MKKVTIGILAHVDAGKTTLTESLLYTSGKIRKQGRVDHGDAFLDYNTQERQRGITIFSKQAQFAWKDTEFILLDTPGHVDFSSEMERTLQVLDYAIIVISGVDGIQSHTRTIWKLLEHYHIPTFLFVNKMDITYRLKEDLLKEFTQELSLHCVDFTEDFYENIAFLDDELLEEYERTETISKKLIQKHIAKRHIFPCFFGSALKIDHIDQFLNALDRWTITPTYLDDFQAQVYKITRDEKGQRLAHVKITGGSIKVKDTIGEDKVDQIRVYSGSKYDMLQEAHCGDIVAMTGLDHVFAGDTLGVGASHIQPILTSYMNYRMILPDGVDFYTMVNQLKQLAEEDPMLQLTFNEHQDIYIQFMGEVQIDILKDIIEERFHQHVDFDEGKIVYLETIEDTVEGVGHFEPLRHYAEVHVLLEPGKRGSGIVIDNQCSLDMLDGHYQRLILSHLQEKQHIGVLTGSPITDIKITLLSGKAHLKHTEGGDFREATYRAVRHGLKNAQSILLEPYYSFECTLPLSSMSRFMFDVDSMHGKCTVDYQDEQIVVIKGEAPVQKMQGYQQTLTSYTKGQGRIYYSLLGYLPCLDQDKVIEEIGYDSESDLENPTGSIFCQHGAGFYVPYYQVSEYMHIPYSYKKEKQTYIQERYISQASENEELEAIFERTYGKTKRHLYKDYYKPVEDHQSSMLVKSKQECMLVDGYNVIFAWQQLSDIAKENLDLARQKLIDILANYQGYKNCLMIIVFDAYKVKHNLGTFEQNHNVFVVYTKEAQTADMYIEHVTHELSHDYHVIVATSDALEQMIVIGRGARRISSRELEKEVESLTINQFQDFQRKQEKSRNFLLEDLKNYQKDD